MRALAIVLLLVGCTREGAASARPKIALVMKSLANDFFQTMEEGARRHHAAHAAEYELVANGIKDEQDVGRQMDLVEQMVARGVDAIVLAPADSKALVGVVRRARRAGVVVVNIDNKLDPELLRSRGIQVPFVGPDNRKGARAVGQFLASRLAQGAPVAIIEGLPTAFNSIERRTGFEEATLAAGLKVVARQAGNWEMAKANQVAAAILTEHPAIKAFLCANDSMALGVVAALKAAGRLDHVKVIGFDNIAAMRELLAAGHVLATADQHGDKLAAFGIQYALDILKNKTAPADQETPVDLVKAP